MVKSALAIVPPTAVIRTVTPLRRPLASASNSLKLDQEALERLRTTESEGLLASLLAQRARLAQFLSRNWWILSGPDQLCRIHRHNCTTLGVNLRARLARFSARAGLCEVQLC